MCRWQIEHLHVCINDLCQSCVSMYHIEIVDLPSCSLCLARVTKMLTRETRRGGSSGILASRKREMLKSVSGIDVRNGSLMDWYMNEYPYRISARCRNSTNSSNFSFSFSASLAVAITATCARASPPSFLQRRAPSLNLFSFNWWPFSHIISSDHDLPHSDTHKSVTERTSGRNVGLDWVSTYCVVHQLSQQALWQIRSARMGVCQPSMVIAVVVDQPLRVRKRNIIFDLWVQLLDGESIIPLL